MVDINIPNCADGKGKKLLASWLNKNLKITMSDGRTLIGVFICTDKDCNVILGSCLEFLGLPDGPEKEEPRMLGLAMVPGRHIINISLDQSV